MAYSTVVTAKLRRRILENAFPDKLYVPERAVYEEKMKNLYKSSAEGCIALQDKMGRYALTDGAIYKDKEAEVRAILSEMPSPEEIERMLALAELDISELYELYGEKKINDAIFYAKDLKDRYTVLWMYYSFFGGEQDV